LDWTAYTPGSDSFIVRRKQVVDTDDNTFDGATAIAFTSGSTKTYDDPVVGNLNRYDYRVLKQGKNNLVRYYHTDHLGTPILLTDGSGAPIWQAEHFPFGSLFSVTATVANNLRFPGQYFDLETGLHQNWFRDYSPSTGRYTEGDPIGLAGGINIYAYVELNPLKLADPTGLDEWDWLRHTSDFSNGVASVITFGLTDRINEALGTSEQVDRCSGWHTFGTVAGVGLSIAIGGAAGAEAAEANAARQGFEFSHWIPARLGGPRSIFNGNYVSQGFHYLTDPFRFPSGWKALGPKLPRIVQQLLRIPWVYVGAGAGAAVGGASAAAQRSCECQ
jgi:RHS repeat-associated protein